MQHSLLLMTLLVACWYHCVSCMPVSDYLNRNVGFSEKYGWPKEALDQVSKGMKIPEEIYTDEQARRFVSNGLLHLERGMAAGDVFTKLGSEGSHISRSFVHGIDDAAGSAFRPRWRWLPLIEDFDAQGQPVYHTSMWSDGTSTKSLDLLRLDFYFSKKTQYFVPTAIVRPIQKDRGFGQGLRFTARYEFPASLARYKRTPTLASANKISNAIHQESFLWLQLVSQDNRQKIEDNYKYLSGKKIHRQLTAAIEKAKKHKNKDKNKVDQTVSTAANTLERFTGPDHTEAQQLHGNNPRQAFEPAGPEPHSRDWDEPAPSYPLRSAMVNLHGQSSAMIGSPSIYHHQQHQLSNSIYLPITDMEQESGKPDVHTTVPWHLAPVQPSDSVSRLESGRIDPVQPQIEENPSVGFAHPGRLGFARWRKSKPSGSEPSSSP